MMSNLVTVTYFWCKGWTVCVKVVTGLPTWVGRSVNELVVTRYGQ